MSYRCPECGYLDPATRPPKCPNCDREDEGAPGFFPSASPHILTLEEECKLEGVTFVDPKEEARANEEAFNEFKNKIHELIESP